MDIRNVRGTADVFPIFEKAIDSILEATKMTPKFKANFQFFFIYYFGLMKIKIFIYSSQIQIKLT